MDKKKLLSAIVLVVAAMAIVLVLVIKSKQDKGRVFENVGNESDTITEKAAEGTLPDLNANPLKKAPDTNPVSKTNPYSDIKTNPFE